MSILSSFKKALGFPDEFDEEIEDMENFGPVRPMKPVAPEQKRGPVSESPAGESAGVDAAADDIDTAVDGEVAEIAPRVFDAVIEMFNASQPEFVRECLNTESQRKYILGHISESVKADLQRLMSDARARGERMWQDEKRKMADDVERLKSEYHSLKQQREEFQSQQLSAARQKRALSERVHDLESQVNALEAEKEQYQLENRSMLNKLRVANVRAASDCDDTEVELQRLTSENLSLQDKIKEIQQQAVSRGEREKKLKTRLDEKDAEIERLKQQIKELPDASEQDATLREIQAQIEKFEEIKKKKDRKINELTSATKKAEEEIAGLRKRLVETEDRAMHLSDEAKTARKEAELQSQESKAEQEALRDEVRRLTEMINASEQPRSRQSVRRKERNARGKDAHGSRKEGKESDMPVEPSQTEPSDVVQEKDSEQPVRISAIDELMDSTDWFIAPEPMPVKKDPEVEEDFGYKEPVRKPVADDDKQLSLF